MNKVRRKVKTFLVIILCVVLCFLSMGCGESLTFEDGEYIADLVADPGGYSSIYWFRDFPVIINDNNLTVDGKNYGSLSSRKISEKNYDQLCGYKCYNNFDVDQLKEETKALATKIKSFDDDACYLLMNNDGKYYLAAIGWYPCDVDSNFDPNSDSNFKISVIWELKKQN